MARKPLEQAQGAPSILGEHAHVSMPDRSACAVLAHLRGCRAIAGRIPRSISVHVKCAWQDRTALQTCAMRTNGSNEGKATNAERCATIALAFHYPEQMPQNRQINGLNGKIVLNAKKRPGIGLIRIILK